MLAAQVKFATRESLDFVEELKVRVEAYFASRGISDKADWRMIAKSVLLLSSYFGAYALLMTNWFTPWQMLGIAVFMGVAMAGIGFAVSHDALHGAYSANPTVNRIIGFTFDLLGANGYMWKITHNVIHHTYTNIQGIDEDLEVSPLIRLSPRSTWHPIHRIQHILAFLLYSFSTIFWVFAKDYKYFFAKNIGPYKEKTHPMGEWANLWVMKVVYYGYIIVLPLLFLHVTWWQFLIGFFAMHMTGGLILGVVFQLAHVVEGPEHPMYDGAGRIENAWAVHQMETSSDFAPTNRLLSWYVGGLNFQVEHHLFPKVCSVHYPAINPIVQEVARKHGVAYHCHPTLRAAIKSHYLTLKKFGRQALQTV
jgi:linoleoyl-CoA desaturase